MPLIKRRRWNSPLKFPCSVVHGSRLFSQWKDCIIMTWLFLQRSDECMHVCMCGRRREKKKKEDWQGKSSYFEGLSIIHEKTVFQRPPERCTRGERFVVSSDSSQLFYTHSENQATPWQATALSMWTDVNAPVHMHISHPCAQLLGLNGDDTRQGTSQMLAEKWINNNQPTQNNGRQQNKRPP